MLWRDLPAEQRSELHDYFRAQVFPVLTPLAVDPAHPFPYISGLSLNLAVLVRDPAAGTEHFARVKVPNNVKRYVLVSTVDNDTTYLPIEELIGAHLQQLFPGLEVTAHHPFRVTRNADIEVEEDRDEDLLQALERELARRRFGPAVRLEVGEEMDDHVLDLLVRELEITDDDVVQLPGLLDLASLWQLYDVDRPDLKEEPFVPATHPRLAEGEKASDVFAALREGDVLVHHPYDSFATSVQRFIEQAAADPHVLAIKQTLYRTSWDSPSSAAARRCRARRTEGRSHSRTAVWSSGSRTCRCSPTLATTDRSASSSRARSTSGTGRPVIVASRSGPAGSPRAAAASSTS